MSERPSRLRKHAKSFSRASHSDLKLSLASHQSHSLSSPSISPSTSPQKPNAASRFRSMFSHSHKEKEKEKRSYIIHHTTLSQSSSFDNLQNFDPPPPRPPRDPNHTLSPLISPTMLRSPSVPNILVDKAEDVDFDNEERRNESRLRRHSSYTRPKFVTSVAINSKTLDPKRLSIRHDPSNTNTGRRHRSATYSNLYDQMHFDHNEEKSQDIPSVPPIPSSSSTITSSLISTSYQPTHPPPRPSRQYRLVPVAPLNIHIPSNRSSCSSLSSDSIITPPSSSLSFQAVNLKVDETWDPYLAHVVMGLRTMATPFVDPSKAFMKTDNADDSIDRLCSKMENSFEVGQMDREWIKGLSVMSC